LESEDGFEMNKQVMSEEQARDYVEPIFDIMRRKLQRLMTLVTDKSHPTPMEEVIECRQRQDRQWA
jgi:hypothetical protein